MRRRGPRSLYLVAGSLMAMLLGCASGDSSTDSGGGGVGGSGATGLGGSGGATQSTSTSTKPEVCAPGKQDSCPCPGGSTGVQKCNADGTAWGDCTGCSAAGGSGSGGAGGEGGAKPCGDKVCADDESCHTCEKDCGPCKPCLEAPKCENVQIPPAQMDHVAGFDMTFQELGPPQLIDRLQQKIDKGDPGAIAVAAALEPKPLPNENSLVTVMRSVFAAHPKEAEALRRSMKKAGATAKLIAHPELLELGDPGKGLGPITPLGKVPPGGTVECGAPMLRMRVARVTVHEDYDDVTNDIVYCAIQSEAAVGSEIVVTPMTPALDEGKSFDFSIGQGIFWGQKQPTSPAGNMMVTYDCFENDDNANYQKMLDALAQGAAAVGGSGVAGAYGWVFTVVGAVAGIVSAGLAADGDDHLLNASQVIPLDKQLALTNGTYWTIRKADSGWTWAWDWELRIEAWGCAEYGELVNGQKPPDLDAGVGDAGDAGK